jgi:hypothetical protein
MWWSSSSGRIELQITLKQAQACSHPGPCDADVAELRRAPAIKRQLEKLDPKLVAGELREYGAWDDEELADHDQNLTRLLWIASNDITEEQFMKGNQ